MGLLQSSPSRAAVGDGDGLGLAGALLLVLAVQHSVVHGGEQDVRGHDPAEELQGLQLRQQGSWGSGFIGQKDRHRVLSTAYL